MKSRWLVWSVFAVVCWGLWAVISKAIGDAVTAPQAQALSTVGILPIVAALSVSAKLTSTGNRRRGILIGFAAGVIVCAGNIAYYHALSIGGKASTVVPLTALYPLVTIVLAVTLLGERLTWVQLTGIALSLVAIWLFNVSAIDGWLTGWLAYAFVPVLLWGGAGLLQKICTNHVSGELSTLWFLAAFIPVGLGILLFQPLPGGLPVRIWLLSAAMGFLFGLGNLALLIAFASGGKASIIAPLAGLYPVVSVPVAILVFQESVTGREWFGIVAALLGVIAMSYESSQSSKDSNPEDPSSLGARVKS